VASGQRGDVLKGFRTLFEVGSISGLSDAELLDRSSERGGTTAELAFAALVERHGPMVLRVCRKALGDPHDAHDAFQSTFLVLARKADAIRDRRSVASFLHGVALRVAASSRAAEARRRRHERKKAEGAPSTVTLEEPSEVGAILHHEVGRLPGRYRDAVVLCYLEGRSCEEAAGHLQLPVGTIKSRLSWARQRLRDRLTKRGLAPAAGAVSTLLAAEAAHATMILPSKWVDATAESALKFAAVGTGTVSGPAAALAYGVIHAMMMNKIKLAAVAALGVLVTGAALMAQQGPGPAREQPDRMRSVEDKLDRLISVLERQAERQATPLGEPVRSADLAPIMAAPRIIRQPTPRLTAPRAEGRGSVEDRLARLEMRMDQLERRFSGGPATGALTIGIPSADSAPAGGVSFTPAPATVSAAPAAAPSALPAPAVPAPPEPPSPIAKP
jgi:RNA polymerase sigma factor (sigma-70 family)